MSFVTVLDFSNEDSMTISFLHEEKQRNMKRPKTEPLEKSLKRIELSLSKQYLKKKSKREKTKEASISHLCISLWFRGEKINQDVSNIEAWKDGSELRIGDRSLTVEVNPPSVVALSLPNHIMAEFPVFPVMDLQFAEVNHCNFEWFRSKNPNESEPAECSWERIGSSFFYKPSLFDIGCYIKLVCTAGNSNRSSTIQTEATSCTKVSAGPGLCPFQNRHLCTYQKLGNEAFRFICYNILAEIFSRDDFAVNILYPYCPPYALDISYRKQILLKELTGYNADIMCLQECGVHLFNNFLQQSMEVLGYQGLLKCKAGNVPEGEATFFNANKFKLVSSHDILLKESLIQDPINEDILHHVSAFPAFLENLLGKNSVAQITVLKDKSNMNLYLCVVNTHLYYKPNAPHIRLVQAAIILNYTKKVVDDFLSDKRHQKEVVLNQEHSGTEPTKVDKVAVIFCGDLNSTPKSALVQLLDEGKVDANHQDWTATDDEDQHCTTINLSHDFNLYNAFGILPFTNFTVGFKDTVDYVFCDAQHIEVDAVIPMPSEEELSIHSALPSVVMPSDHIALVCDLKWKA